MTATYNNVAFGPLLTPAFNYTGDGLQTANALSGLGRDLSSWTLRVANLLNLIVPGAALPIPVSAGGTGLTTFTTNVIYKGAGAAALAPSALTETGTQLTLSYNVGTPAAAVTAPTLQVIDVNSSVNIIELDSAAATSQLVAFRTEGTVASPTQTAAATTILVLGVQVYDNTPARAAANNATIRFNTISAPTSTDHSTSITLNVTPTGSTSITQVGNFQSAKDGGVQLVGTSAGDNASAGVVGEYLSTIVLQASEVSINAAANVATLSVTAGDWDVWGELWIDNSTGAATLSGRSRAAITTSTAAVPTGT